MNSCGCSGSCSCDERPKHYMFFGNLQIIQRAIEELMQLDPEMVDNILEDHSWAVDHISTSTDDITEVANFFLNKAEMHHSDHKMMTHGMDNPLAMVKSFESFVFEKKSHKLKSKKKKDQDMVGDRDFADAKIAQYMAGGMSKADAIKMSRKFNKK